MCTDEKHDSIKADAVKWSTETYPIASEPVLGLDWRNCADCHSTLAKPIGDEVQS